MNIRFPYTLETVPSAVHGLPGAIRRSDSRTRLIVGIAGAAAVAALVWYLVEGRTAPPAKTTPPVPVTIGRVQQKNVQVVEHTIGTILAESTVQLTAQVTGQLLAANFREGQIVRTGDLLFQIDPRPFQAALEQANATLARDQASLVSAANDEKRFTALFAQGAASQQQRDQAVATAKGLVATVQSDKAAIDVARLNLGYTKILSPITGKTGPILIQPGNLVTANGTQPLVTITQIQPVKVSFFLAQNDLAQIQTQMSAGKLETIIPMPGAADGKETAPVNFIGNAVSSQTGTIELRATFANTDFRLVPGQTVDVGVTIKDLPGAILVPRDAVNAGPDKNYVYVVNAQSKAISKPVTVLNDDGINDTVQGPIRPGDRVIVEGQLRVVPGSSVVISKTPHHPSTPTPIGAQ